MLSDKQNLKVCILYLNNCFIVFTLNSLKVWNKVLFIWFRNKLVDFLIATHKFSEMAQICFSVLKKSFFVFKNVKC